MPLPEDPVTTLSSDAGRSLLLAPAASLRYLHVAWPPVAWLLFRDGLPRPRSGMSTQPGLSWPGSASATASGGLALAAPRGPAYSGLAPPRRPPAASLRQLHGSTRLGAEWSAGSSSTLSQKYTEDVVVLLIPLY